jgi:hypothetical protein
VRHRESIQPGSLQAFPQAGTGTGRALAGRRKLEVDETIGTRRNDHGIGGQLAIAL